MRIAVAALLALAATAAAADDRLARARALEAEITAVVERVRPAVVAIEARGGPDAEALARGGSGILIDPAGLVLTNHHVAGEADEVFVILTGSRRFRASVLGRDPDGDLCLLSIAGGPFPAVAPGDTRDLRVGDWVFAMGNPRGVAEDGRAAVSFGILTAVHALGGGGPGRSLFYGDALQTDAELNPGNSGGPLFDHEGRLIGINGRIATRTQVGGGGVNASVGFSIPADQILRFLPLLKAGGVVRHGFLGVRVHHEAGGPVTVAVVLPGSAAERDGVRAGDVLLALDGEPVTRATRLTNLVSSRPAGARAALRLRRDGEERVIVVTLGARAPAERDP